MAYQLEDALTCGKISNLDNKDDCYSKLALMLKDQTICNKAENPLIKCKKYFEVMALDSSNWNAYRNKEGDFEFRIAPIFEEVGYEITEAKSLAIFLDGECDVISFKTHPIEPYYGSTDKNQLEVFMPLYICPKEYCHKNEEGRQFYEALRGGRNETESGDWIFANYVSENEDFIVYEEGGPSKGDLYDALGWDKGEILGAKDRMLSTFRFLE